MNGIDYTSKESNVFEISTGPTGQKDWRIGAWIKAKHLNFYFIFL
ncbi:MAG: hypothetical protein QXM43_06610 [Desulfurococcaceae archaeon]